MTLSIRRVTLALAITVALLAALGISTQLVATRAGERDLPLPISATVVRMFDLDREGNIPTWYQTCALLGSAMLLWAIAHDRRRKRDPSSARWAGLAVIFLILSLDEAAQMHEALGRSLSARLGGGLHVYAWLIPGTLFTLAVGIVYAPFLMRLPPKTRAGILVSAAIYLFGAIGLEILEAFLDALWRTTPFVTLAGIEESLEMVGVLVFVHTLLSYMRASCEPLAIRVEA